MPDRRTPPAPRHTGPHLGSALPPEPWWTPQIPQRVERLGHAPHRTLARPGLLLLRPEQGRSDPLRRAARRVSQRGRRRGDPHRRPEHAAADAVAPLADDRLHLRAAGQLDLDPISPESAARRNKTPTRGGGQPNDNPGAGDGDGFGLARFGEGGEVIRGARSRWATLSSP